MSAKTEEKSRKGSLAAFLFGHEKLNKADIIEIILATLLIVYIVFYILKVREII